MNNLLLILLPIISAVISSYLTYYFSIKQKKDETIRKFKEEKYSNLVILLKGFVGNTVSADKKKKFFEEQYKSWLYCSDEVVVAINNMVNLLMSNRGKPINPEEGKKAIGNIIVAMRKDLLGKTKLKHNSFLYIDVID